MDFALTPQQSDARDRFRDFAALEIAPHADRFDRDGQIPDGLIRELAATGWLGAMLPREHGGQAMDALTTGMLCEEIGGASGSMLSLLTVHGMVCQAILRWGTPSQRGHWLPRLATGESIGAFALTEPDVGSDAKSVTTRAVAGYGGFRITGEKTWISFGQRADLFLVLAQCDGQPAAFLVPRDSPGISTIAINDMLGFRSAMLARVVLNDCRVPEENLLGRIGFGFTHVAGDALDHGRFRIAWGCLGLIEASLAASLRYSGERRQFGVFLRDHQLIQQMLTDMITDARAARLLCQHAAVLRDQGGPSAIMETSIAKYHASRAAARAADSAVQIHGANGCHGGHPVQRYFRDARIMEIIEGSNQMQQIVIAQNGHQQMLKERRRTRKVPGGTAAAEVRTGARTAEAHELEPNTTMSAA